MDTSFHSTGSRHNIHFVACGDCHNGQRPANRLAFRLKELRIEGMKSGSDVIGVSRDTPAGGL
jgi:hypothetical protein